MEPCKHHMLPVEEGANGGQCYTLNQCCLCGCRYAVAWDATYEFRAWLKGRAVNEAETV